MYSTNPFRVYFEWSFGLIDVRFLNGTPHFDHVQWLKFSIVQTNPDYIKKALILPSLWPSSLITYLAAEAFVRTVEVQRQACPGLDANSAGDHVDVVRDWKR